MKKKIDSMKTMVSILSLGIGLSVSTSAWSQGTGNFAISNSSFKELFNNYRKAEPKNIPWAGSYWAYARDGLSHMNIQGQQDNPPAMKYDAFWGVTDREENTHYFEKKSHSCSQFDDDPETKKSCEGWWGHCNAWAAAGIKEPEPRKSFMAKNPKGIEFEFTVADQKGLLTELWMSSGSLFAGDTHKGVPTNNLNGNYLAGTKDWVFDPTDPEGKAMTRSGRTAYQAFWDVSPRTLFLIFTNYVGIQRTGVVIDRFTGDQVWNQPIVGYRLLPIKKEDIKPVETNGQGQERYPVTVRMKMFWAEDGVHEHEISDKFTIEQTNDQIKTNWSGQYEEEHFGRHFSGRMVEFILFFDAPVEVSEDGTQIVKAGNIVGEGLWSHKTEQGRAKYANMDNTHPDFIWLPTQVSDYSGNRNPWVQDKYVRYIWDNKVNNGSVDLDPVTVSGTFVMPNFVDSFPKLAYLGNAQWRKKKKYIAYRLNMVFSREGIPVTISYRDIWLKNGKATIKMTFAEKVTLSAVANLLKNDGIDGSFVQ